MHVTRRQHVETAAGCESQQRAGCIMDLGGIVVTIWLRSPFRPCCLLAAKLLFKLCLGSCVLYLGGED
eukprot:2819350-Amphidinium_carterae.1